MRKVLCLLLAFIMLTSSVTCVMAADSGGTYVYRNDTYDFEIMPDSGEISDEEFFGKWNSATSTWTKVPYFKYDDFTGLIDVENAAKSGDYVTAKTELLEYYRAQKDNLYKLSTNFTGDGKEEERFQAELQGELQARNVYATDVTGTPIGIVSVSGNSWQEVSTTDVLTHVKNSVSSKNVAFVIASIDKSNTAAEIKSKESGVHATLTLKVNGVEKEFKVSADSYISPVDNADKNYGSKTTLYAQEYGYVGHWTSAFNPWDSDASATKRTYLKFDISSLKSTDKIESAELKFTARVASGGDLSEKELFIYGWGDASWTENKITWNTFDDWLFFSCNDQEAWDFYTHPLADTKGKICYFLRGTLPQAVAKMYGNTGDEKYAYTFLRQMMSCAYYVGANRYADDHTFDNSDKNPDPKRGLSHLDIGGYLTQLPNAFVMVWDSQTLTDNPYIFTALLKNFVHVTNYMAEYIVEKEVVTGNMATSWNRAMYLMCNLFPEIKDTDYWYDLVLKHNERVLNAIVYEDGSCFAQGFNYIWTELSTFSNQFNVYNGTKVHHFGLPYNEASYNVFHKMVKNALYSTSPGWGGFGFGDSIDHGKSYSKNFSGWYSLLTQMSIDDPELKYINTNGKQGKLPDITSISFPDARRTYMRTGWEEDDIALAFTAKGDASSHKHNDQMSVVLMAYGKNLLVDPSYASILTDSKYAEVKAGASHNTITVNGGNIYGSTGQDSVVDEMEINDLYDHATYTYAYVQNASNFERNVLFLKKQKFFIVSDYILASDTTKENVFTQHWHMLPDSNIYISDKNEFRSNFESGANIIVAPVDAAGMSDKRLDDSLYCPATGSYVNNKKGVYERKSNTDVKYGTVLYPLEEGQDRTIETTVINTPVEGNGANAFSIKITDPATGIVDTYYYYHLNDIDQKQEITLGDYKTDASTILIHENASGKLLDFFVYDASYVKKDDFKYEYIFKSSDGEKTFGVDYSSGNVTEISSGGDKPFGMEFSSDNIVDSNSLTVDGLKNIALYTDSTTSSTFNGEVVQSASKNGNYWYYGDWSVLKQSMSESGIDSSMTVLSYFGGENPGATPITSSSIINPSTGSSSRKTFALSTRKNDNKEAGNGELVSVGYENGEYNEYYWKNSYTYLLSGYKTSLIDYLKEKPVFVLKYDIKIPVDANVSAERIFKPIFSTSNSTSTDPTSVTIKYADSKFTVSDLVGLTPVENKSASYTPGTWATVEYRAYRGTDGKLICGVYIDGEKIFCGTGDIDYSELFALYEVIFMQNSNVTTYMDEIVIATAGEEYKPDLTTDLSLIDFDGLSTAATTDTFSVSSEGALASKKLVRSGTSKRTSTFKGEVRQNDDSALVVTTAKGTNTEKYGTYMVNTTNQAFGTYVNKDDAEYILTSSYDIYIPNGTEASKRWDGIRLADTSRSNDILINSYIEDGKLWFDVDINNSDYAGEVEGAEKSVYAEISSGSWHTINYVMKVRYNTTEGKYYINLYGIYKNVCYYKNELTLDADELNWKQRIINIEGIDTDVVTKYDNIRMSHCLNIDNPVYAWPIIELDATTSAIKSKIKIIGSYDSLCLVTAVFNEEGSLVKLWTDKELDSNGYLSNEIFDSTYLMQGYKARAFLLDSLTSAIPYAEKAEVTIK